MSKVSDKTFRDVDEILETYFREFASEEMKASGSDPDLDGRLLADHISDKAVREIEAALKARKDQGE